MSLSHEQARDYLQAAVDGRLSAEAAEELQEHLERCVECRQYAAQLAELEDRLSRSLQMRWTDPPRDKQQVHQTVVKVQARIEKRKWARRVFDAAQAAAWVGLAVALVVVVGWIFAVVTPQLATPAEEPVVTRVIPSPTPLPTLTPLVVVEPIPTPELAPEQERTLTICKGDEPDTLYLYGGSMLAQSQILDAVYDGPIDNRSFSYQPVILNKLPSLADGDAIVKTVTVGLGERVVSDAGEPVTLEEGVQVRPSGCYSADCAVVFDGAPLEMEQMVVTFTLKPGLRWSDGEPLTAYDSVYSFELNRDPDTPADKQAVNRTARYEALDDYTIVWTGLPGHRDAEYFTHFWSPLPAHAWGELTPLELVEAKESAREPMGWGAYVIEEWVAGDHIRLRKNENYWRADEGLPKFDTLIFRFVGQNSSANIAALLAGECDVLDQTASLDEQSGLLLELQAVGKVNASFVTGTVWEHADFGIMPVESYDRPDFFGDVRVRQAIAYCVDRQEIVDQVLYGQSVAPDTYLPPEHPLYNPEAQHYPFDPAAGMRLLEQAGWVDHDENPDTPRVAQGVENVLDGAPLAFNYWTTNASQRQAVGRIIQDALAECGVKINLEYWDPGEFFADGPDGPLAGRHFDMAQFAWLTGVEPPCELYTSSQIPAEENEWSGQNYPGFSHPAFDAACNAARQSLPGTPEYEQYHHEAQRIFAEQLPVIPLYLRLKLAATRPDLSGFVMDPTAQSEFWNIEEFGIQEP